MTPYFEAGGVTLYHGDCREVLPMLSVDAILTDPPYPAKYLPLYGALARIAADVLPEGGSLLSMAGPSYLPEVMELLGEHLNYHWTIAYTMLGGQAVQIWPRQIIAFWKPVLWYSKGKRSGKWVSDVVRSPSNDKQHHHWGQHVGGFEQLLDRILEANVVADPFAGGGTMLVAAQGRSRKAIGIEIDEAACESAARRLEAALEVKQAA